MRLFFRSHSDCARKGDKRYYEQDRSCCAPPRRCRIAFGRIGGDAADSRHSLDIYVNLWQSRALQTGNTLLSSSKSQQSQRFDLQIKAKSNCCTILMLSARYLEAKNKKDEGGYNDVDGNPSFFELWNRMHSML
jgi:hypothetical protein